MEGIKISALDTVVTVDHDDICLSVTDLTTNGTKNITVGNFAKSIISQDSDNLLEDDANGLIKADADTFISADTDNLLVKGSDEKLRIDVDNDLNSTDADNIIEKGTDGKLYVPAGATPDATETTKGKAELATSAEVLIGTDDERIVTPLKSAELRGLETVETITLSNQANKVFENLDDGYNHLFIFEYVTFQTDGVEIEFQISRDGGSIYINSDYSYDLYSGSSTASNSADNSTSDSHGLLVSQDSGWGIGNDTGESYNSNVLCYNPANSGAYKLISHYGGVYINESGNSTWIYGQVAMKDATTPYDTLKFYPSSGNFLTGKIIHKRYRN